MSTTWKDLTNNSNDGTLVNFSSPSTANSGWDGSTPVTSPSRLKFDGTDDYIQFNTPFIFNQNMDASIQCWINFSNANIHKPILWGNNQAGNSINRFHLATDTNGYIGLDYVDPASNLHCLINIPSSPQNLCPFDPNMSQSPQVQTGEWTNIAISRSGNTYSIYKNGIFAGQAIDSSPSLPTSTGWKIGARELAGWYLNASLSSFRGYNKALSASEIKQNFDTEYNLDLFLTRHAGFSWVQEIHSKPLQVVSLLPYLQVHPYDTAP